MINFVVTPAGRRRSRAREVDSTGEDQKSELSSQVRDGIDGSPDNIIPIPPKRQPDLKIDTEDLQRPKPKSSIALARGNNVEDHADYVRKSKKNEIRSSTE